MLARLAPYHTLPVTPQAGSALTLPHPLAIPYATLRHPLFDPTLVIRRSVVYTALAAFITLTYALLIAAANALLAQHAELARSPWFSAAFIFGVVLAFNPLRTRLQRWVDVTFFRERYDYARTIR